MFKCYFTKVNSRPGDKANKVIIKTRPVTYFGWRENEETGKYERVSVGYGMETVKEVLATDEGVRVWNKMVSEGK